MPFEPLHFGQTSCGNLAARACMNLAFCRSAKAFALCDSIYRSATCYSARGLPALSGIVSPYATSTQPRSCGHSVLASRCFCRQTTAFSSMPWATALGCKSHISLARHQLNGLKQSLSSSQRIAQHAAPYVGCLTLASAAGLHVQQQQSGCSKHRQPVSRKGVVADAAAAFSSMQHIEDAASPSNSDSESPEAVPGNRFSQEEAQASERSQAGGSLVLRIGASCLPHPEKAEKGGEDAYFMTEDGKFLGVADGVGGWSQINIDSGVYSRLLMQTAKAAASVIAPSSIAPQVILEEAHSKTNVKGTSTACILALEDTKLHAANLGDSGFLVVRKQKVVFKCPSQQHRFNFPYQLGCPGTMSDLPEHAELYTVDLTAGDIIVAATDGLFDNVYNEETAVLVSELRQAGHQPEEAASGIAQFARRRAADPHHPSPFAHGATLAGWPNVHGGKMDDITVLVAYAVPSEMQARL